MLLRFIDGQTFKKIRTTLMGIYESQFKSMFQLPLKEYDPTLILCPILSQFQLETLPINTLQIFSM